MTAGKNDTNAFAASATPRSMNSFSSMRSQTRQKIVLSAQLRALATSRMTWLTRSRAPATHSGEFIRQPPRVRHRRQLRPARDQGFTWSAAQPPHGPPVASARAAVPPGLDRPVIRAGSQPAVRPARRARPRRRARPG